MMNNSAPQPQPSPAPAPQGHKNWVVLLIFIIVAVMVGVLLTFHFQWTEFFDPKDLDQINTNREQSGFNNEIDGIDTGDLDAEFMEIEKDTNSL